MADWFEEPMPSFSSTNIGALESSLSQIKQEYYNELVCKAANLFYFLIKNHPFENGNKRMAVALLILFFMNNGYWLEMDSTTLYKMAIWVASSTSNIKETITEGLEVMIENSITTNFPPS
jgi:death on curing protein